MSQHARMLPMGWTLGLATISAFTTPATTAATAPATTPASAVAGPSVTITLNETVVPRVPGYHVIKATARVGDQVMPFACGIFLPPSYFRTNERMAMVVTLHTRGNSGADGGGGLVGEGLGLMLGGGGVDSRGTGQPAPKPLHLQEDARFILIVPQCPAAHGWDDQPVPQIVATFVTEIAKVYRGDEDRVYLTGFSYGGTSTWNLAAQVPGRFAAIAPLDGRASRHPMEDVVKLRGTAVYLSVGSDDGEFIIEAERMRTALVATGHPRFAYHVVRKGNHWGYGAVYNDPAFWDWLLAQRRATATAPATMPGLLSGARD